MGDGFRSLITWQKAYDLALEIYKETNSFPKEEIYGLTSQIRRSVLSVPANIAEGYEREYRKEYLRFLMIAKGSLGELETYLLFCRDMKLFDIDTFNRIDGKRKEVGKMIVGLARALNP